MSGAPWLTILILVPLAGAVLTAVSGLLPGGASRGADRLPKLLGLGFSGAALVVAALLAASYSVGGGMQYTETYEWIGAFGASYAVGMDGLSLVLVLLTVVLVPVVLLASWPDTDSADGRSPRAFVGWVLALEAAAIAVFLATDVFFFYVVFEATLIPAYFLVGGFGRRGAGRAALKFLVYQLVGGLVLLGAVIGLYVESSRAGEASYLVSDLAQLDFSTGTGRWLFLGFFVAFAIKAPLFPVHTWLADTTEKATPGVSVLLVCVLDKIGTYGMLRFCLGLFPEASQWATPVVIVLALVSIVYGALLAIGTDDLMRLIGLTSLSHFGFIVLGIFVLNTQGTSGSILYMVNHGLATAALFLVGGFLVRRRGTASIRELGGVEKHAPVLAGLLLVAGLATLGLPGLSTFVSEFLVLVGAFVYAPWVGAVAVTGIVLAAIYVLWAYQRTMTGPSEPATAVTSGATPDLGAREIGAIAPLVVLMVVLGFFPMPALDVINPYVEDVLQQVGVSDEAPTVPASQPEGTP
ncbi:NADH-quinone oxidoreductase subunit M [Nocardioides lentus]|uniref:NADH-quinone oxidoreductase subunit M n=1 Tax=Nocardioides lentus TaxID=338077 RepID=A0ABN2PJI4_9ACTN